MPQMLLVALTALLPGPSIATPDHRASAFLPLGGRSLDPTTFAQWLEGKETSIPESTARGGPCAVVWSTGSRPEWQGVRFGEGRASGVRHLRIGTTETVAVGSVLVRGGGVLSVLRADAPYPGNLADEAQWLPAERLVNGSGSTRPVENEGYALWVLPSGTKTRALRFSHTPRPGDRELAGWLGGVWLLGGRYGNIAQALVQSAARDDVSVRLVDESNNRQWQTWENAEKGAAQVISPRAPEFVTLTWPRPVALTGICLLWTGFAAVEVEAFRGPDGANVREAPATSWQRIASRADMDALYPLPLGAHWLALERPTQTRPAIEDRPRRPFRPPAPGRQGQGRPAGVAG